MKAKLLAALPPSAYPGEGINSITGLLQENVIPLVITVVGIFAVMAARRGEVSNVLTTFICVVFAIAILAFAIPGPREAILNWIAGLV